MRKGIPRRGRLGVVLVQIWCRIDAECTLSHWESFRWPERVSDEQSNFRLPNEEPCLGLSNDFLSGIQGGEDALHFFDNQMTTPMVRISEWFRQIATSKAQQLSKCACYQR